MAALPLLPRLTESNSYVDVKTDVNDHSNRMYFLPPSASETQQLSFHIALTPSTTSHPQWCGCRERERERERAAANRPHSFEWKEPAAADLGFHLRRRPKGQKTATRKCPVCLTQNLYLNLVWTNVSSSDKRCPTRQHAVAVGCCCLSLSLSLMCVILWPFTDVWHWVFRRQVAGVKCWS